ncbi:eukaryotic translation initiation factor 2A [Thraustotheca clavata]|uniref:Eukaryotic translation initiation factor 2A n=1 Tax=Thraustotheca clavata TaxID=74557 RepID=A0A1V9Z8A3_9STRA|nr:eukaryotic translation initiation factor 2A [Thraustotheca clavata]
MDQETPRTKFYTRGKTSVEPVWGLPSVTPEDLTLRKVEAQEPLATCDSMFMSPDGSKAVFITTEIGYVVRATETDEVLLEVTNPGIQAAAWSPLSTQLVTWQRPVKDSTEGNLIVWDISNGTIIARFNQKSYTRDHWPSIQWSSDEAIAARLSGGGVQIYNGRSIGAGNIGNIALENTTKFSVAPGGIPYKIALFVPEKKGKPASTRIYQFPPNASNSHVAFKSFYKAQDVKLKWAPNGSALIIETSTDVDTSGKSYYGETNLFFLQSDGQYDCSIPVTKQGPVHDVQWDPASRGFVVLAGSMPANATLYDNKACPTFEFGAASRNTISWSPHGRFLCLAGFGNLPGHMDFWDRNKLKKLGSATSECATVHCWSPDSRYFATATTFPRVRVDNGYKIFKYDGIGPVAQESRAEIYDFQFRPAAPGVYPNRPASPRSKEAEAAIAPPAPVRQAYRPPNSTGALAAMLRREDGGARKLDRNKYAPVKTSGGAGVIPGMAAPVVKKPSKSEKKKKAIEAAAAKAELELTTQALLAQAAKADVKVVLTPEEKQKKAKGIQKKLKQIQDIKTKQTNGDTLNEDQLAKLSNEAALQAELESLA